MPRLRHYKNYEQIGDTDGFTQSISTEEVRNGEPKGWWSNGNIITNLSDKQIERNIQYHKTQIKNMEEELLNRALGLRVYIPFVLPDFGHNEELEYENSRENYKKNSEVRYHMKQLLPILKSIRKRHGMDAFVYCRDEWMVLLEDYYNEKI